MLSTESIGSEKVHDYVTSSALTIKNTPLNFSDALQHSS
jgi:hypothetical protein